MFFLLSADEAAKAAEHAPQAQEQAVGGSVRGFAHRCSHRAAESLDEEANVAREPRRRGAELDDAARVNRAVSVQQASQQCPPVRNRRKQIGIWHMLGQRARAPKTE